MYAKLGLRSISMPMFFTVRRMVLVGAVWPSRPAPAFRHSRQASSGSIGMPHPRNARRRNRDGEGGRRMEIPSRQRSALGDPAVRPA